MQRTWSCIAQDTFIVARSAFLKETTSVGFTSGISSLTTHSFPSPPTIGGYNLCYLRPQANLAAITKDENRAPFVASWQAGLGRTLAYTGEADGAYAGAFAKWKHAGDFFSSLARWTAGISHGVSKGLVVGIL